MEELKMEKFYLGISLGFNSSACVVSSMKGPIFAISQERLNLEKNTKEVPYDAINACIDNTHKRHFDKVCICYYEDINQDYFNKHGRMGLEEFLELSDVTYNEIVRINHHDAHAYSPLGFYTNKPNPNDYIITSDGFGDGLSGTIRTFDGEILSTIPLKNSIALVYQFVTGALGFTEHKHEGKITGLAGFGIPKYIDAFEAMYVKTRVGNGLSKINNYQLSSEDKELIKKSTITDFGDFISLKHEVYQLVKDLLDNGAKREDIASSVQLFAEKFTLRWINRYCQKGHNVYLAGGLFANVTLNKKIKDMGLFNQVYVAPPMGDEGTCVGACIYQSYKDGGFKNDNVSACLGTKVKTSVANIIKSANITNCKVTRSEDIGKDVARLLSQKKIVCLVKEDMEFGPRALCHRSILYDCTDKDTNDWLNKKLGRTEFMPFAPVVLDKNAKDLFKNFEGGKHSAKHMTMTFDGTQEFVNTYHAACHVDNTARPQVVNIKEDPIMYRILDEYQRMTGLKALINTSFNLHNHPIIESFEVAYSSWIKSDIPVLVIGNIIIER